MSKCNIGKKNILITGATGYIGSMLVKHIKGLDGDNKIIAAVRDRKKAENMLPRGVDIVQADLSDAAEMGKLELECDYIIHCASVTNSAEMISRPAETIKSIVNTAQNVLELAAKSSVKSMVNLSSMEVYGKIECRDGQRISEEELGSIDIYNVRSCYPLGKRMVENVCYSYFKEYGVPVKTARLAQTFGRGVPSSDNRVFMQFARAVKENQDIILHTMGNSMGNYCGIDDALSGIMAILHHGADGEAYNVVNEDNTMTIRQMAVLVATEVADGKINVRFDIPESNIYGYAAETGLRMSGRKLTGLGWKPSQDLLHMYRDVIGEL